MDTSSIIRLDPIVPLERWPDYPESEISSGTRSSSGLLWFQDDVSGFGVGVWEADANLGRWMHWPVHEFMVVVEGEVVMVEEDRETVIGPGECFFIPKGRRCIWNQAGYFKKIMAMFNDKTDSPDIHPIAKVEPHILATKPTTASHDFPISEESNQQGREYFKDSTGQFTVGARETIGQHEVHENHPYSEVKHVLEGKLTLIDHKGRTQVVGAGDTVLVLSGTSYSWSSEGVLNEIFCRFQPISSRGLKSKSGAR